MGQICKQKGLVSLKFQRNEHQTFQKSCLKMGEGKKRCRLDMSMKPVRTIFDASTQASSSTSALKAQSEYHKNPLVNVMCLQMSVSNL